jgi:hypothetical protein
MDLSTNGQIPKRLRYAVEGYISNCSFVHVHIYVFGRGDGKIKDFTGLYTMF